MTKTELILETRDIVADKVKPYKWSDTRVTLWLSEAQDRFCELTGYWTDNSTYTFTTVLGQQDYALDSRIIAVRTAWVGTLLLTELAEDVIIDDLEFADSTTQSPASYRLDLATGYITIIEPVIAGVVVTLRVHRKSLIALSAANGQPEIPEEFQLGLAEYAAYKALGDHDQETQDPVKAADHYRNFKSYVRDGSRAYRRITGNYLEVVPNPLYVV